MFLGPAIRACRNRSHLVCTAELVNRLTRKRQCSSRIPDFVFVINRQLFVSLVALARIAQCTFPEFVRTCQVSVTLCQSRECRACGTMSFLRQHGDNRLFVQFASPLHLTTSLADARDTVQFQAILRGYLFVAQK